MHLSPTISLLFASSLLKAVLVNSQQFLHPEQEVFHAKTVDNDTLLMTTLDYEDWIARQEEVSWQALLRNINPAGAIKGFVAASPSTSDPDYFYSWTRDSALVMRVVAQKYYETGDHEDILRDYVAQEIYHQVTRTQCDCLGEPKFNADGSGYDGPWGRPQNDGPALRASTFILFAKGLRAHHPGEKDQEQYVTSVLAPAIFKDLDYVADTWSSPCFDLWEEVCGIHFYTLTVMRQALLDGALFADEYYDPNRASRYQMLAVSDLSDRLDSFWVEDGGYIAVTQEQCGGVHKPSGLDVSILLAANHALRRRGDETGVFTSVSDKVLATAVAIEDAFERLYPLNLEQPQHLGTAIGRYPEDTYDGYQSASLGNPWFLATLAYAELYYNAIQERDYVAVNEVNAPFFAHVLKTRPEDLMYQVFLRGEPDFDELVNKMLARADAFMKTVQYHARSNGSLSEQYDRYIGFQTGARDLTWSYAAFITAANARRQLLVKRG